MASPSRHLRGLFAINESPTRWPIALKAALAMGVPLVVATLLGHQQWGLVGNMGAFAALYGPKQPRRFRFRLLVSVAAGLIASAAIGALVAPWPWLSVLVTVVMAGAGAFACAALQIGPPGAFFFTLVMGGATNFAQRGMSLEQIVVPIALSAIVAVAIGMSDVIIRPYGPETRAIENARKAVAALDDVSTADNSDEAERLRTKASVALHQAWTMFHDAGGGARSAHAAVLEQQLIGVQAAYVAHHTRRGATLAGLVNRRSMKSLAAEARALLEADRFAEVRESHLGRPPAAYLLRNAIRWPSPELLLAARTTFGALLAGVVSLVLHSGHPYWAIAFCVLMLHQGGTRVAQTLRSIQRFAGTIVGLGLYWVIALAHPRGWWLVLIVVALQFTIQELVTRNYGAAVIFMTPMALLLISTAGSPALLAASIRDRVVDTLVCSVAAIIAVWVIGRASTSILLLRAQLQHDAEILSTVLRDRAQGSQTTGALARRQFLHYELVNTTGVLSLAKGDDRNDAQPWQPVVSAMRGLGMLVLGMCWYPTRIGDAQVYDDARERVRAVVHDLDRTDPERVHRDLDRVHRTLLTAGLDEAGEAARGAGASPA